MSTTTLAREEETTLWKALADPTRRKLLDVLRQGPRTTGHLAATRPELSRFGVMKHIKVLKQAGLVLTEARGRERWHRVNPVPIRALHERWVQRWETEDIDRLLRLKSRAENPPNQGTSPMTDHATPAIAEVVLEIEINADCDRTFNALVDETSSWWHPDFYTAPGADRFVIERKLGGKMFEDWGNGEGQIWATVNGLRAPNFLQAVGDSSKQWGGPHRSIMTWNLEAKGDKTLLRFQHDLLGNVSEATRASLESGWQLLFVDGLKSYLEN